jgi:hypothetical protein
MKSPFYTLGYIVCLTLIYFYVGQSQIKLTWLRFIFIIIFTPLVSFPYVLNGLHVNDPERIFFPISILLSLLIVITNNNERNERQLKSFIQIICFSLLVLGVIYKVIYWVEVKSSNSFLISTVSGIFDAQPTVKSILIMDDISYYGDVYSLYEDVGLLDSIINQKYVNKRVVICSSSDLGKEQFYSNIFPIQSTKLCQEYNIKDFDLNLKISTKNWVLMRNDAVIAEYLSDYE